MIKILRIADYVKTIILGKTVYQRIGAYRLVTLPFVHIELIG